MHDRDFLLKRAEKEFRILFVVADISTHYYASKN